MSSENVSCQSHATIGAPSVTFRGLPGPLLSTPRALILPTTHPGCPCPWPAVARASGSWDLQPPTVPCLPITATVGPPSRAVSRDLEGHVETFKRGCTKNVFIT